MEAGIDGNDKEEKKSKTVYIKEEIENTSGSYFHLLFLLPLETVTYLNIYL